MNGHARAQARPPKGVATTAAATSSSNCTGQSSLAQKRADMTLAQRQRGVRLDTPASDQRVYIETSAKVKEVKGRSRKRSIAQIFNDVNASIARPNQ